MGISARLRRASLAVMLSLVLVSAVLIRPVGAAHSGQATPARLSANIACAPGGAVDMTFTIHNIGRRTLTIDGDMHFYLARVRRGGPELVTILFMWPAPSFKVIRPGQSQTFMTGPLLLDESGSGADLSTRRLLLEAEVWFDGREQPVRRIFSFPNCKT